MLFCIGLFLLQRKVVFKGFLRAVCHAAPGWKVRVNFANDFLSLVKMAAPARRVINTPRLCTVWGQVSTFSASNSPSALTRRRERGFMPCRRADLPHDIGKLRNDFIAFASIAQASPSSFVCLRDRNNHLHRIITTLLGISCRHFEIWRFPGVLLN